MDTQNLEQLQRVTDPVGQVVLLELNAPSFPDPLRIANDTINHTLDGVEYIALPFGFKLPEQMQGGSARAKLVIDNVGRGITDYLEDVLPNDTVMAKITVCAKTTPLRVMHDTYLPLTNVSVNGALATADAGIDYLTRQKAVKLRFTPYITPGIF